MIPIVNLNSIVDKKLELEHQSLRNTRRWISDANQNIYESWYPTKANHISGSENILANVSRIAKTKPSRESYNSILTRISNLINTRRQPVRSKS